MVPFTMHKPEPLPFIYIALSLVFARPIQDGLSERIIRETVVPLTMKVILMTRQGSVFRVVIHENWTQRWCQLRGDRSALAYRAEYPGKR